MSVPPTKTIASSVASLPLRFMLVVPVGTSTVYVVSVSVGVAQLPSPCKNVVADPPDGT